MKNTKSGKDFFKKLLKDPSIRMQYEEESSKTKLATANSMKKSVKRLKSYDRIEFDAKEIIAGMSRLKGAR